MAFLKLILNANNVFLIAKRVNLQLYVKLVSTLFVFRLIKLNVRNVQDIFMLIVPIIVLNVLLYALLVLNSQINVLNVILILNNHTFTKKQIHVIKNVLAAL